MRAFKQIGVLSLSATLLFIPSCKKEEPASPDTAAVSDEAGTDTGKTETTTVTVTDTKADTMEATTGKGKKNSEAPTRH